MTIEVWHRVDVERYPVGRDAGRPLGELDHSAGVYGLLGELVRCGPAGAVWRVDDVRVIAADDVRFKLLAVDAHEVPLDRLLLELPMWVERDAIEAVGP